MAGRFDTRGVKSESVTASVAVGSARSAAVVRDKRMVIVFRRQKACICVVESLSSATEWKVVEDAVGRE